MRTRKRGAQRLPTQSKDKEMETLITLNQPSHIVCVDKIIILTPVRHTLRLRCRPRLRDVCHIIQDLISNKSQSLDLSQSIWIYSPYSWSVCRHHSLVYAREMSKSVMIAWKALSLDLCPRSWHLHLNEYILLTNGEVSMWSLLLFSQTENGHWNSTNSDSIGLLRGLKMSISWKDLDLCYLIVATLYTFVCFYQFNMIIIMVT